MPSSLIGSLRVALSLGTAEFETGAAKAAAVAKTRAKEIESSFAGAKAAVSGLFAAFTVGLLTEQIKKSLDYAGSIAEVSRTLGVTTKDLQTFRYAATQTGVSQDQLEVGLRRLTVSMGKAELGSKAQQKAFGALGITVDQLKGKTTGDVFRMMSDSLSKVTDRSQRAAIEMVLMGRSGSTLDNLLAPGSARLNELAQAAQQLGIVLSDSTIQKSEETAHKLEAVKMVLSANIAGVVAENAHSILTLAGALAQLTGQIVNFMSKNPAVAFGLIGMLTGKTLFGPVGAAAGLVAGATYGSQIDTPFDPGAKPNVALLTHNLASANMRLKEMDKLGGNIDAATKGAQVRIVQRLTDKLNAALGRVGPVPAGTDLPQFLGGGGGRTKHAHEKKAPEDKTEQDDFEFAQQQRQIDMQILEAKKSLSHDYVEQTTISIQMLDIEKAIRDAEVKHKLAQAAHDLQTGRISTETFKQIKKEVEATQLKEAELDHLKRQAVLEAEQEQRYKDVAALDQQALDLRKSHLQDELALVTTAQERRALELKILDIDYQIQKAKLEEVLADKQSTDQAKELARRQLIALNQDQDLKRQNVISQTSGPLEKYISSLPTDAKAWQEALQGVAVNGFGALEQAILDTISGTKKLGAAFADMAKSIIADLIKIGIERSIIGPLANALFPNADAASVSRGLGEGGGGGGGLFGLLRSLFGGGGGFDFGGAAAGTSLATDIGAVAPSVLPGLTSDVVAALPGFAGGGSLLLGGMMGTDRNVLAMNGVPIARVGYGEQLNVAPKGGATNDAGMGAIGPIHIHLHKEANRETAGQIAREVGVRLAQARRKGF